MEISVLVRAMSTHRATSAWVIVYITLYGALLTRTLSNEMLVLEDNIGYMGENVYPKPQSVS